MVGQQVWAPAGGYVRSGFTATIAGMRKRRDENETVAGHEI